VDVARHVAECAECRDALAALVAQAELAGELRAVLGTEPLRAGTTRKPEIEGYEDLELLSRGGQGVVWRAVQRSTRRTVAIKLLVGAQFASASTRARFEREVELAASLRHPHLVTVFDSGETQDGAQWFAMEYVEGEPFGEWAKARRTAGEHQILRTYVALCRAIDAAHRRGVLHRDLKSSNVLVDADGAPHVLDFGLAATREPADGDAERLTRTGEFMGTLAYASPEHLLGDPRAIEVRSDVYSLGVLGFEALTGRFPHDVRGTSFEVAHRIRSRPIDRVPLRGLAVDLATILEIALAEDSERRYATAGALADDIERYLGGEAIDARRDSAIYVLRKTLRRHRGKAALAALALMSTAGAAVVSTSLWRRAEGSRVTAEIEADRANELSAFWKSLFDSIDPDRVRGRRVELREVLDAAAGRLAERPPRSREAERELAASIGRTYHKLGRNDLAWPHLARAAGLSALGDVGVAKPNLSLLRDAAYVALMGAPLDDARRAVEAVTASRLSEATKVYLGAQLALREGHGASAVESLERLFASQLPNDEDAQAGILGATREMAELAFEQGRFELSTQLAERALPLTEARFGVGSLAALHLKQVLALALSACGREREAQVALAYVREQCEVLLGARDPRTVSARFNLAILRGRQEGLAVIHGELAEYEMVGNELAARSDLVAAAALAAVAQFSAEFGDRRVAAALKEAELVVLAAHHAPGAFQLAVAHIEAASHHLAAGDSTAAFTHAELGLNLLDQNGGAFARRRVRVLGILAVVLARQGRVAEALERGREGVSLAATVESPETLATAQQNLAFAEALNGEQDAAIETLKAARAQLRTSAGFSTRIEADLAHDLGDVLLQQERAAEAEIVLREALGARKSLLGVAHPDCAATMNLLGTALFHQRKGPPELPRLWHEALAILEARSDASRARASVLNNLGAWAQVVERDKVKAEEYLRRGLTAGEAEFEPTNPLLAISLANVASFDLAHGDHELAVERLRRAVAILVPARGEQHSQVIQLRRMLADAETAARSAAGVKSEEHRAER